MHAMVHFLSNFLRNVSGVSPSLCVYFYDRYVCLCIVWDGKVQRLNNAHTRCFSRRITLRCWLALMNYWFVFLIQSRLLYRVFISSLALTQSCQIIFSHNTLNLKKTKQCFLIGWMHNTQYDVMTWKLKLAWDWPDIIILRDFIVV